MTKTNYWQFLIVDLVHSKNVTPILTLLHPDNPTLPPKQKHWFSYIILKLKPFNNIGSGRF